MTFLIYFIQYSFGVLFLFTSLDKIRSWKKHKLAIDNYQLTPTYLSGFLLVFFVVIELFISISLLFYSVNLINTIFIMLILFIYTVAIILNIYRGHTNISCGCGGFLESKKLSVNIVLRNLLLIACSIILLFLKDENIFLLTSLEKIKFMFISTILLLLYGVCNQILSIIHLLKNFLKTYIKEEV
ncbi:MauE/DoxX family redox-associated membrane protein [Aneurinibacillus aneurinilyticus]|uniref:MauE/DoxX family redox-associated membrane protein n=1 Tax=Aneurinibacillus aneurinilyticus TaxID=1391 RepID=UPI002E23E613|nr:MauE/DoxX family redox-associated membrane protein [Aneurinibacillus aneurinilyticus]MED0670464.1 MauE/DoxX family redox-associated membrane protein [Aneurinibacillus aneurinilyticus]